MKRKSLLAVLACAITGPNLAASPWHKAECKKAFGAISMVSEATQVLLLGGRIKDDTWRDGATVVVSAACDTMMGAYRMDADGYNEGLKAMCAGCKTCHKVHKKDDE